MSKIIKQTTSYLLIIVLIVSVFAALCPISAERAQAASYPTGYPNTYTNTGSGATDIVGVARTQIGYKENSVGTKYGYWYTPSFVNQPWCAMFVSWCANQAGVSSSVITKFAACSIGISWFKSQNRWYSSKYYGGTYTPKRGDIVFYSDSSSQSQPSHVGIVAGLNGNYLDVIEGNATNSSVCEYTNSSSRSLSSSYVIGYGNPKYSTELNDEPTDHEVWQVNADALNMRKTASTSANLVTTLPFSAEINVTEVSVTDDYVWGYTVYGSKKGWVALDFCDYIYGSIDGVYYQLKPTLSPSSKTLYLGFTQTLQAENALGGRFTSSDASIAKVNSNGKITAVKAGKATITLTTATGSATCIVKVKNPTLTQEATACIGDSVTLAVNNAKSTPVWSSSDENIATVDSAGTVTAVNKGVAVIKAEVNGLSLECTFTVTKTPKIYENFQTEKTTYLKNDYVKMKSLVKIPLGTVLKISEVYYSDTYTWGLTSFEEKTGWVILNKCSYVNGTIDGTRYLVKPYLAVASAKIYLRETVNIEVLSGAQEITYTSLDKKIAKVNSQGKVTGLKAGTVYITAKSGKTTLKFKVKVINPILSSTSTVVLKDTRQTLSVTGGDGTITWKSSDKSVVSINSKGTFRGKKFGTAVITAVRNGVTMTCNVTVSDPVLKASSKIVRVNQTKTLAVLQTSGEKIKWKSSDKSIVKVNSKGEITGVKIGKTTVTATVDGVTLVCNLRVAKAV